MKKILKDNNKKVGQCLLPSLQSQKEKTFRQSTGTDNKHFEPSYYGRTRPIDEERYRDNHMIRKLSQCPMAWLHIFKEKTCRHSLHRQAIGYQCCLISQKSFRRRNGKFCMGDNTRNELIFEAKNIKKWHKNRQKLTF